jgi:glycine/D-amino acid oxidase-like deaminating enzyme
MPRRAVIVGGAGCTGLVSALYLAESGGVDVTLYVRPNRVPQLGKNVIFLNLIR